MALMDIVTAPANYDDYVDDIIIQCLNPDCPKSFFLYAGAGSGKTRSLVTALESFRNYYGSQFYKNARQIAIITYTNAACDEIKERTANNSQTGEGLFHISTIHSFCWFLIQNFHSDIQKHIIETIPAEIQELEEKERKGRQGTKASIDRLGKIRSLQEQRLWLSIPRKFTYNPNGNNFGQASLSHSQVLKITAHFILNKPIMREVIVKKFPFILIDESQDTNKSLIDAFFYLENSKQNEFALGLIGDQMQRIYLDGKERLDKFIPERWVKPEKKLNHRCPQRIIQLSNSIRSIADGQIQKARDDSEQGYVRIFIAPFDTRNKRELEKKIKQEMSNVTGDSLWLAKGSSVKSLTLEHHMAAKRMGFLELFTALDRYSSLKTGIRDGSLSGTRFFSEIIDPLIMAYNSGNHFQLMSICRKHSDLLQNLNNNSETLKDPLKDIREAIDALVLCANNENAKFEDVLKTVARSKVFPIPNSLQPFLEDYDIDKVENPTDEEIGEKSNLSAWRNFLETPYKQIQPYTQYIGDEGEFDTHQGVKGREFKRVLVVIDDEEARGFLFSYDKILTSRPSVDLNTQKETIQDRTLRLLYVTCTRAKKSLALVVYSKNPNTLKNNIIDKGWFLDSEIIELKE